MARIVPDDWKSLAATGAAARERETLALLRPGPFRRYLIGTSISDTGTWMQVIAQVNPLYHCVALVRDVSLDIYVSADLVHIAVLLSFAVVMWRLAVWRLEAGLID